MACVVHSPGSFRTAQGEKGTTVTYTIIDAVGWLSKTADGFGASRVAGGLHTVWRRLGKAWHPDTFSFVR